jgi:thiol-disulfide isomerase/thioredoxin
MTLAARRVCSAVIVFLAIAAAPSLAADVSAPPRGVQKQLGDLDLRSLSGEQVPLTPYITRKAVVVVFWAAWCPICKGEVPHVNRLNDNHEVKVLAVNEGDSPRRIKEFIWVNRVSYQVVVDPVSDLANAFGVPGMPYCVIIGKSGLVVYRGSQLPKGIDSYIK